MKPIVRFAPSPTGRLHVGNIRTALANWLFAQKHQGSFILRLDDTDVARSTKEFAAAIQEDLLWLGITFDQLIRQSERFNSYNAAIDILKRTKRLYPCYETADELELKRKQQLARGKPPIYDRAALQLTAAEQQRLEAEGRKPHWRFLLTPEKVSWQDLVHGHVEFEGANLSDPVLLREDGSPIFTLSTVVDDIELGVTHVLRGDDQVANTAIQMQMITALGEDPAGFTYAHLPLLMDISGASLSKRLGSLSINTLRQAGMEPMAINSLLAKIGTSDAVVTAFKMQDLVDQFDMGKFNRSSPKFDAEELEKFNSKLLHEMPYEIAKERLEARGMDESFWNLVHGNLNTFSDVKMWWQVCYGQIDPQIEDKEYIQIALDLLPLGDWNEDTWKTWTNAIKVATGRKGKELFMPLRKALTGCDHGPEMQRLILCIGKTRGLARLKGERA